MLDKPTPSPTDEQLAIIAATREGSGNIIVNAFAGTGKTTTLDFIQAASPKLPVLCLAFNKSVAEEATKRFPTTTTVRTFNSLGHRVWTKAIGNVTLIPKKTQEILKDLLSGLKGSDRSEANEGYWDIYNGVATAKSWGYIPEGIYPHAKRLLAREPFHASLEAKPTPLIASLIDQALAKSIKLAYAGSIDFNDQIYMPALFGGTFPQFPFVMVDEGQDQNAVNHAMLEKLVRGRVAIVGDDFQSIYAFRGAIQGGMRKLQARYSAAEFTISYSFRCPQAVVEAARWRVPGFKWVKEGGHVEVLRELRPSAIAEGAAIICRNNAPLFRCAMDLLQSKRSVHVAGSEIGPRIVRLLQKLGPEDLPQSQVLGRIGSWLDEKIKDSNSPSTLRDMADCMKVFATFGLTLGQAVAYAEHLFKQQGTIKLLTGHKAKGGEWDTVYFLDPWLVKDDDEQELNLRYVIQTRSANALYEIDSKNIRWNGGSA